MNKKFLLIYLILTALLLDGCTTRDAASVREQRNRGSIVDYSDAGRMPDKDGRDEAGSGSGDDKNGNPGDEATGDTARTGDETGGQSSEDGDNGSEEEPEVEDLGEYFMPAIEEFKASGYLPDGTKITLQGNGNLEDCEYAMEDVDNDGKMELLFRYAGTMLEVYIDPEEVAETGEYIEPYKLGTDMFTVVYSYNVASDTYTRELFVNSVCTFFDKKRVMVEANDGFPLSDPENSYQIYEYDPSADSYAYAGYIYEWNKNICPTGQNNAPFPTAVDKDESLKVYALEYKDRFEPGYIYDDDVMRELDAELFRKKQRLYWYYV